MVQKMAQGCGRLIRGNKDRGIICCLDSRVVKYLDAIRNCTPYVNYTDNIDDIVKFSNKYIKKLGKNKLLKKQEKGWFFLVFLVY